MNTHYTDMKGKPCPLVPRWEGDAWGHCFKGYCPVCIYRPVKLQKERARELAKEIDNLGEK